MEMFLKTTIALWIFINILECNANHFVPILTLNKANNNYRRQAIGNTTSRELKYLPFIMLVEKNKDNSEYWREMEILTLVTNHELSEVDMCDVNNSNVEIIRLPSKRSVAPICRTKLEYQLCPQCSRFNNHTECELFRDSCRERRVRRSEYETYCDRRYGKWRTMFIPADYSKCRCCDECVFYRELDQSCLHDEYDFDLQEFLPVTTIDFRAGCNQYLGHPHQEMKALRCDNILRRCVPIKFPRLSSETMHLRSYRYEPPPAGRDCPASCRGYGCPAGAHPEHDCSPGAFIPDNKECNCCGHCSAYHQLHQKCAEFKKTVHNNSGTMEIEIEEEFLEPGCDDGLVCRQGICQDIHTVEPTRRKREPYIATANEPCKQELKYFKKKYGSQGHLHFEAPQCTPLWLYAPVQCRRFVCYCALEDGSIIQGIKVPRVEVSQMNCDCAREKCRLQSDIECDGFGNYKEAVFTSQLGQWEDNDDDDEVPDQQHAQKPADVMEDIVSVSARRIHEQD